LIASTLHTIMRPDIVKLLPDGIFGLLFVALFVKGNDIDKRLGIVLLLLLRYARICEDSLPFLGKTLVNHVSTCLNWYGVWG